MPDSLGDWSTPNPQADQVITSAGSTILQYMFGALLIWGVYQYVSKR